MRFSNEQLQKLLSLRSEEEIREFIKAEKLDAVPEDEELDMEELEGVSGGKDCAESGSLIRCLKCSWKFSDPSHVVRMTNFAYHLNKAH